MCGLISPESKSTEVVQIIVRIHKGLCHEENIRSVVKTNSFGNYNDSES